MTARTPAPPPRSNRQDIERSRDREAQDPRDAPRLSNPGPGQNPRRWQDEGTPANHE